MKDLGEGGKPGFVMPMVASRVAELPTGPKWQYEVKWDGYRILAVKDGERVQVFSRRGASYPERFAAVTTAVAGIHAESAVLDGEVVAVGGCVVRTNRSTTEPISSIYGQPRAGWCFARSRAPQNENCWRGCRQGNCLNS